MLSQDSESLPLLSQRLPTPLPKTQLFVLFLVRMVDPIAYSVIFPFINQYIDFLAVTQDPSKVGFYSGLVETAFALAQFIAIYPWAILSDHVGRKPVITIGTFGIAITTFSFGLSGTFPLMLLFRFLGGIFGGTVAAVHSNLAEITDSSNQAVAFPIYGLSWTLGNIIGPLIGGSLSDPSSRFPAYFNRRLFKEHPYLLPCLVSSTLSLSSVCVACFCLEESLRQKRPAASDPHIDPPDTKASVWHLLSSPMIRALTASSCMLSFNATAFDVAFVLFCYSPIRTGGLSFSVSEIGSCLVIAAFFAAVFQLTCLPYALRNFEKCTVYNFFIMFWPFAFLLLPLLNLLARDGLDETMGRITISSRAMLWFGVCIVMMLSRLGLLAYSVNMILVKDCAPSSSHLGATNGIVQAALCLSRAASPAFVSSLFAMSVEYNICGGQLWVIVMIMTSSLGCFVGKGLVR